MSTRSMVAIKQADGTILAMWKHWDGYPKYMIPFLENYKSDELAQELVRFKSVDSFMTAEEKERYQQQYPTQYPEEDFYKLSTGDYLFGGIGTPETYRRKEELCNKDNWAEWAYIWDGYDWVIYDPRSKDL